VVRSGAGGQAGCWVLSGRKDKVGKKADDRWVPCVSEWLVEFGKWKIASMSLYHPIEL
jgi:hypothetical protein